MQPPVITTAYGYLAKVELFFSFVSYSRVRSKYLAETVQYVCLCVRVSMCLCLCVSVCICVGVCLILGLCLFLFACLVLAVCLTNRRPTNWNLLLCSHNSINLLPNHDKWRKLYRYPQRH